MIISHEEADTRLASKDNLINRIEVRPMRKSGFDSPRVPGMVRELLGSLAITSNEDKQDIAKVFSVSTSTVSRASRGLIGDRLNQELREKIDEVRDRDTRSLDEKKAVAHNLVLDNLMTSLSTLAPKLVTDIDMKPAVLARIASDMARISKHLTPEQKDVTINNTQVILYKPEQKKEESYETIDA